MMAKPIRAGQSGIAHLFLDYSIYSDFLGDDVTSGSTVTFNGLSDSITRILIGGGHSAVQDLNIQMTEERRP